MQDQQGLAQRSDRLRGILRGEVVEETSSSRERAARRCRPALRRSSGFHPAKK
jgi:hypothetical protein